MEARSKEHTRQQEPAHRRSETKDAGFAATAGPGAGSRLVSLVHKVETHWPVSMVLMLLALILFATLRSD
jgi:hypothetical protein